MAVAGGASSDGVGELDTPSSLADHSRHRQAARRPDGTSKRIGRRGTLPAGRRDRPEGTSTDVKRTAAGRGVVAAALCGLVVVLGGCAARAVVEPSAPSSVTLSAESPSPEAGADADQQPGSDQPFGTDCSGVPADGEGSFAGMKDDPVGSAAGNIPVVTTLTAAIRAAHLVGPLDRQQEVTVLAPADPAFAAVAPDALGALMADTPRLTAVLTHHVLQGRLTPEQLPGTHTTRNNYEVTIAVTRDAFSVAADPTLMGAAPARVICGNLQTANATVYLIDQVLTPPAA